jgi:hypothetical protein
MRGPLCRRTILMVQGSEFVRRRIYELQCKSGVVTTGKIDGLQPDLSKHTMFMVENLVMEDDCLIRLLQKTDIRHPKSTFL